MSEENRASRLGIVSRSRQELRARRSGVKGLDHSVESKRVARAGVNICRNFLHSTFKGVSPIDLILLYIQLTIKRLRIEVVGSSHIRHVWRYTTKNFRTNKVAKRKRSGVTRCSGIANERTFVLHRERRSCNRCLP